VVEHVSDAARRDPALAALLRESEGRVAGFGRGELSPVSWETVLDLAKRARSLAGSPT